MSYVLPASALTFLAELERNNTKAWMDAHRARYERELREPAKALAEAVNEIVGQVAPDWASDTPHKTLGRINRDIRFSADKTPYNTHLWMGFGKRGTEKGRSAGFYVGVAPGYWAVGGGTWNIDKDQLGRLRGYLAERWARWEAILAEPAFVESFGEIQGERYKRVPKPYPADHPAARWLTLKNVHARCDGSPDLIPTADFLPTVRARLRSLAPLVGFLDAGIGAAG